MIITSEIGMQLMRRIRQHNLNLSFAVNHLIAHFSLQHQHTDKQKKLN